MGQFHKNYLHSNINHLAHTSDFQYLGCCINKKEVPLSQTAQVIHAAKP